MGWLEREFNGKMLVLKGKRKGNSRKIIVWHPIWTGLFEGHARLMYPRLYFGWDSRSVPGGSLVLVEHIRLILSDLMGVAA